MYVIHDDGRLVEMSEQPYDSEGVLQRLLADYPNLLAGDQMNSAVPRRWLLLAREVGIPGEDGGSARWSVDHLFVDQDAIPTLVEVKRSSDTRIRREVVGQMLDYAANAVVYCSADALRSTFEARCAAEGSVPATAITAALGREDIDVFWTDVVTNLQAGKVRMVFVADAIPPELQRIVEFLNAQMRPGEVLAIEIRQFVGHGLRTLIPRVIGQTAVADASKGRRPSTTRTWDEASFFRALAERRPTEEVSAARHIYDWARANTHRMWWGRGWYDGSCYPMLDHNGHQYWIAALWTSGHLEIPFQYMLTRGAFATEAKRLEYLRQLNAIPGMEISATRIAGTPYIPLARFGDEGTLRQLLGVLTWAVAETESAW
jgi:hypothetical protein